MTGIASKKENLVASCLDNPKKSPAVIVIPDLDVPGISANTWARPIKKPVSYTHLPLPTTPYV